MEEPIRLMENCTSQAAIVIRILSFWNSKFAKVSANDAFLSISDLN
jgi:hypothetical protein